VVVGVELDSSDAGDRSSVSDAVELVCGPPVLCTTPLRGSAVVDESAEDELSVFVDVFDDAVVDDAESEPDGEVEVPFSVDEEADEVDELEDAELDDELESDGSASATPGMVAIAVPTPSATANAPTRPT
jgi:hypothetical protein